MTFQNIVRPLIRKFAEFVVTLAQSVALMFRLRYVEGNWTHAIDQFKSLLQRQFIDDGPCKTIIKFM
jgi:hypothetical protein